MTKHIEEKRRTMYNMMIASIEAYRHGEIGFRELESDIHWFGIHMDNLENRGSLM